MNKKICFSLYCGTTFLTEIFFPGGTQPKWKISEIPGARGFDKHLLEWKFQGRGGGGGKGLKQKPLRRGGMDIFWNCTI